MFRAKLNKAVLIKRIFSGIKELVQEINFVVSKEGINVQAMDPAHVALLTLNLSAQGFDEFQYQSNKKEFKIGVSIPNLNKVLNCGDNVDSIAFSYSEDDPKNLIIRFEYKGKNIVSNKYNI